MWINFNFKLSICKMSNFDCELQVDNPMRD